MHPTNRGRRLRVGVLVLIGMAAGATALTGQEPAPPPARTDSEPMRTTTGAIIVPIGVSQNLSMASKKRISTVQVDKDGIVRAAPNAVDPTSIVLSGLSAGSVRLTLTDVDGKRENFDVIVQLDITYLKKILADAVPTASVEIKPVLNKTLILTGWVTKAEDVDMIVKVASAVVGSGTNVVNAMQVGGVQQVQLDVTVASVSRTEARRRGFSWALNTGNISMGSILGGLVASSSQQQQGGGGGAGVIPFPVPFLPNVGGSGGANFVFGVLPNHFQGLFQALRDEQLAKLLAEPKLVTLSGRPAHFIAGGQQAVLSAAGGLGGPGVDFKNVGTELTFLPIVEGNGRIYLEVAPQVRNVNQARGITTSFGFVPGVDEQSVRTALELEPGQTMAIGGLIFTQTQSTASRVPVLGDLPFIGAAFSTVFHQDDEQELLILVTPHLVDGEDCRQAPKALPGRETRKPDDYELFLEGILEAPRGQRQVFENGKYKAAYKSDPSYNQYPCADPLPREPRGSRRGGRGGAYGCSDGSCGVGQPMYAPTGMRRGMQGAPAEMMGPPMSGSALLPGAPMPGPALDSGRMIPPTAVESLPAPRTIRELPVRNGPDRGPSIPQPRFDDDPR